MSSPRRRSFTEIGELSPYQECTGQNNEDVKRYKMQVQLLLWSFVIFYLTSIDEGLEVSDLVIRLSASTPCEPKLSKVDIPQPQRT